VIVTPGELRDRPQSRRSPSGAWPPSTPRSTPPPCSGRSRSIARRRGKKKAIVAVGRSILVIVWHLLSDDTTRFHDLGPGYYDSGVNPERKKRNHIRELEALAYRVTLQPAA